MADTILRLPQVRQQCGLSRTAVYAAIARGDFPRQVQLGTRSVGWRASDIEAWVGSRLPKSPSAAVHS
jgi:prophage regulatory protein